MCCDICLNLSQYIDANGIVCGRTMEFCEPLKSKLTIIPRGRSFTSETPIYKLDWVSSYGFVAVKILDTNVFVDGINEVGLSCGILTMDATQYSIPSLEPTISIIDVCSWLLGLCSTVDQAVTMLKTIKIYGAPIPVLNRIIGLHIVIHDSLGTNVVCEILNDMNIYYTYGVVTNGPHYPTQLDAYHNGEYIINNILSLWSSTNRFIKLSELKRLTKPESYDNIGLVNLICHIF